MNENQELADYLKPTEYIDSDNPDIVSKAEELTEGLCGRQGKTEQHLLFRPRFSLRHSRFVPLPRRGEKAGERRAEQRQGVLHGQGQHVRRPVPGLGHPLAHRVPAASLPRQTFHERGGRQDLGRPQAAVALAGRGVSRTASGSSSTPRSTRSSPRRKGRVYSQEFDGVSDIPSVEGPLIKDLPSHTDYPKDVADWYEQVAKDVVSSVKEDVVHKDVLSDEEWSGPDSEKM